ncbi:hypothetical protein MKX03_006749 [Papaver bracteatum]|nr:hypothetical protein MKX03_006749 [Papaver bracteatum]
MGNQKRIEKERKTRVLCLHGFRTSGEIIKKQVTMKWLESMINKLDFVYICSFSDFTDYRNFEECLEYIQDIMLKKALTKVPKIKFLIIKGGAMFRSPIAENAYIPSSPIQCPSLHFLVFVDFVYRKIHTLVLLHPHFHCRLHPHQILEEEEYQLVLLLELPLVVYLL